MLKLLVAVLLMVTGVRTVEAQESYTPSPSVGANNLEAFEGILDFSVWVESAIAFSSYDPGIYLRGAVQSSNQIVSVRGIVLGSAVGSDVYSPYHFEELGLMYGWASDPDVISYSVSTGISMIRIAEEGQPIPELSTAFPVDLSFSFRPTPLVGIGLTAFANINTVETLGGVALRLDIGFLR